MTDSLRGFVARLEAAGQLLRVRREVDPKFELAAVVQAIQRRENLPVLFERVRGTRSRWSATCSATTRSSPISWACRRPRWRGTGGAGGGRGGARGARGTR